MRVTVTDVIFFAGKSALRSLSLIPASGQEKPPPGTLAWCAYAKFLQEEKLTTNLRVGSVTLMHFDMVHRGTARALEEHLESVPFRSMFK